MLIRVLVEAKNEDYFFVKTLIFVAFFETSVKAVSTNTYKSQKYFCTMKTQKKTKNGFLLIFYHKNTLLSKIGAMSSTVVLNLNKHINY